MSSARQSFAGVFQDLRKRGGLVNITDTFQHDDDPDDVFRDQRQSVIFIRGIAELIIGISEEFSRETLQMSNSLSEPDIQLRA